jgi:hypothetical protein
MRIAAFLGMSLMMVTFSPQEVDLDEITVNGKPCGLEGTAKSEGMKDLNRHKNRWAIPDDSDIDHEVSLAAMLAPGKDVNRFDQEKAAKIQGFVIDVKMGGTETCNCGADDPDLKDTHIELALAAGAPEIQRVIVEVTPRLRKLMKMKMPEVDWTTAALHSKFKEKWVEVTGWLTFDTAHIKQAENTNQGHKGNWRATCWEIHPVTNITLLDAPPEEAKDFQPTSFAALQKLHANHLARSEPAKASIAKMHRTVLSKFHQKDVKEAEDEAKERKKQQP